MVVTSHCIRLLFSQLQYFSHASVNAGVICLMKTPVAFSVFTVFAIALVGGCRHQGTTLRTDETNQPRSRNEDDNRESQSGGTLQQQASRIAGDSDFYMKFWVVEVLPNEKEGKRKSGNLYFRSKTSRSSGMSYSSRMPSLSNETTIGGGQYNNHGYRKSIQVELKSLDESNATFTVNGEYEFRRPKKDADKSSRLPFVWYGKTELPEQEIVIPWQGSQTVSYDITEIDQFAPFRKLELIGNEIRIEIENPNWSNQPIEEENTGR